MKTFRLTGLLALLLICMTGVGFASCSDDDDPKYKPSADLTNELDKLYPDVRAEWETRHNMYRVAEFTQYGDEYEVWFTKEGQWVMTEIDFSAPYQNVATAAMDGFFVTQYGDWTIDDITYYKRASDSFYVFDVEKRGEPDMDVYIDDNGGLIKAERETDRDILPSTVIN